MNKVQKNEEQQVKELSTRFYTTAVFIITTSFALLYYVYTGGTANEGTIPFTNIVVKNISVLKKILFGMVIVGSIVLDFEWLRYRKNPKDISDVLKYISCLLGSITILFITYPSIVQHTSFQTVSRWQWLTMVILGIMFGRICSNIRNGFRFIRPKEYAEKVHALRIPIMTRMSFLLNGTGFLLILGSIIVINFLCGQLINIHLYLVFFAAAVYFFFRWQLAMTPECIKKERDLIELTDNFAYEKHATPFLLPQKLNDDKTSILQEKRITRDEFRTFNVQTEESIDTSIFKHIARKKINDFIVVNVNCRGGNANLRIPLYFVHEAFRQLQLEQTIVDDEELLQESIFWATVFVITIDQYKHVSQTRPEVITKFVFAGFHFVVSLLLQLKRCNLNDLLYRGWTPLLAAAAQGETEIAKTLLFYGADPDKANLKGITPLMYTARYNHHKTCKVILAHSPNLNLQDEYGSTAIIVAVQHNSKEVFELLLKTSADLSIKDNKGKTALDWAYQNGLGEFARKIKDKLNN